MNYRMRLNLGALDFNVTTETVDELLEQYRKMGGDPLWLIKEIQSTVGKIESGQVTVAVSSHPDLDSVESAQDGGDAWAQDGPWNAAGSTQSAQKVDPWDNTPVSDNKPAQTRSAPSRPSSQPSQGASVATDKFGREFTLGLPDAPNCNCGSPAARVKGKSRAGKPYTMWKCAKEAPDGDWRSKCDFAEFPK